MTLFGSDAVTPDLVKYPRLAYARHFAGGALPDLTGWPAQVRPHVSTASGGHLLTATQLATIKRWLGVWGHLDGDFTIDHEVNLGKKGTPATFKANYKAVAPLLAGTGWRLTEVFAGYGEVHSSTKPGAAYKPCSVWHSPDARAQTWDHYVPAAATSLPDPEVWAAPVLAAIHACGLPGGISEWGFPPGADPDGTAGPVFAAKLGRLAKDQGLYCCSAWDNPATGTPGVPAGGYVLTGATLVAWQTVIEVG